MTVPRSQPDRCSFCQVEIGEVWLTDSQSGAHGRRKGVGRFCSPRCLSCVRALAALQPSPLASAEFVRRRGAVTDRLLELWRNGEGPDPAGVLRAARGMDHGLTFTAP